MTAEEKDMFEQRALWAAGEFIKDQLPDDLLVLSVQVDTARKHILLRAHFASIPSEDDLEKISVTATEVVAQYYDWDIDEDWEVLSPGQQPSILPSGIAFSRGSRNPR